MGKLSVWWSSGASNVRRRRRVNLLLTGLRQTPTDCAVQTDAACAAHGRWLNPCCVGPAVKTPRKHRSETAETRRVDRAVYTSSARCRNKPNVDEQDDIRFTQRHLPADTHLMHLACQGSIWIPWIRRFKTKAFNNLEIFKSESRRLTERHSYMHNKEQITYKWWLFLMTVLIVFLNSSSVSTCSALRKLWVAAGVIMPAAGVIMPYFKTSLRYVMLPYLLGRTSPHVGLHQQVQNTLARIVLQLRRRDHITPALVQLHWLPVRHRVTFKIATITFNLLKIHRPSYLYQFVQPYTPSRNLRSLNQNL